MQRTAAFRAPIRSQSKGPRRNWCVTMRALRKHWFLPPNEVLINSPVVYAGRTGAFERASERLVRTLPTDCHFSEPF